jgi:hypothetical protein
MLQQKQRCMGPASAAQHQGLRLAAAAASLWVHAKLMGLLLLLSNWHVTPGLMWANPLTSGASSTATADSL